LFGGQNGLLGQSRSSLAGGSGAFPDPAVYLVGPVVGGVIAALVWSFVLLGRRTG
jgi:glycerol uptake facilitator-like aquaporin